MEQHSHLPPFALRPIFKAEVPFGVDDIGSRIKASLAQNKEEVEGKVVGNMAVLSIPPAKRHFWSPQLTLGMDTTDTDGVTMLRGMYGPSTSVWLGFVFIYGILGIIACFALIIGSSHWMMDKPANEIYLALLCGLGIGGLYLISFSGQKVGADQMQLLHEFVENCLHQPIISSATDPE